MENKSLQIFNFEGHSTRIIMKDGEPWFVGADVCKVLGYVNAPDTMKKHCKHKEKMTIAKRYGQNGGAQFITIIPKGDVYRLIARSNLPAAQKFEEWLFDEVVPAIEKHGAYMTPKTIREALTDPDTLIAIAQTLKEEQAKVRALQTQIAIDEPKVLFAEAVTSSKTSILIGDFAKILRSNGVQTGRDRFFRWLRENGYLIRQECRSKNMPTQTAMEMGLFEVEERVHHDSFYGDCIRRITKLTGKGQMYFINKLCPKDKA